ncbi:MAG: DUF6089 family protein [Culturomica sp.]|nr:DUF6089 family protein [Culturomica sp.]
MISNRFFTFWLSLFPLLLLSLNGFSQPGAEIGIMAGQGYYIGEYNPASHFNSAKNYGSLLYRYNLNDRFAIRLNVGFSEIEVTDVRLPDDNGALFATGFSTTIRDFSAVAEFNFRSFMAPKHKRSSLLSPYVFVGVGYLGTHTYGGANIPLGAGVKFNIWKSLSGGVEWSMRKLFTDRLDNLEDPWKTGETNFIYNKDTFFVAGVTLTYRFPIDPVCWGYR